MSRYSRLTPMQRIQIISWWKAKQALGNFKTKAKELGCSHDQVQRVIRKHIAEEKIPPRLVRRVAMTRMAA